MTIPSKKALLSLLQKADLRYLADMFNVAVADRRANASYVEALVKTRTTTLDEMLVALHRNTLKEMCRKRGLDDGGRAKAVIVTRLLGGDTTTEKEPVKRSLGLTEKASKTYPTARRQKQNKPSGKPKAKAQSGAILGFESKLWDAADLLRSNMDPAEYKHVVLGLLFLKYIEDAFDERREELKAAVADPDSDCYVEEDERDEEIEALLEDRDEFTAENVFWVPKEARWTHIQGQAKQPTIGKTIDDAMDAIERENPTLKGVLPKIFALPNLDKHNLGKLIDLVSSIGLGTKQDQDKDTLGQVYEYFLSRFASAEGKGGGEFYTPASVVRLLVEMLEPYKGRVYDPCCGSGGMFVQSIKFIDSHNGKRKDITVFGQESNRTTWRMARMNLAIRGIEANLGAQHADSFHRDLHPDLRADFILANPPFNISQWGGERLENDVRWKFGPPYVGNANYAWLQHILHHLNPTGSAGVVLANGSMSTMIGAEAEIRRRMVDDNVVDCIVELPGQLFFATPIPVCLWILSRNRAGDRPSGLRDRRGEMLFIYVRKIGRMETRTHRVLDPDDIRSVASTYRLWRSIDGDYSPVPGRHKSVSHDQIRSFRYLLQPGRYVGFEDEESSGPPARERLATHLSGLRERIKELRKLDDKILAATKEILGGDAP